MKKTCSALATIDPQIYAAIEKEHARQQHGVELIASENFVSQAVLEAQGSILTNKYAEGYPGKRYYGGCEWADVAENLAISRAKQLFGAQYVNVQPHSGSQANQAVFMALLQPGDTIMGLSLNSGGHLTHGARVNLSGKWFNAVCYEVDRETGLLNYEEIAELAAQHKPKLIITGYSAYPRQIDFAKFRQIADTVGAYLHADVAHIAGLIAAGYHPTPIGHAHVITTTTHKTLRGPRGGMILTNDEEIAKKVNSAIFPGIQGGPLMHVIAAKAVAFAEALQDSYKEYIKNVISNAQAMANTLQSRGYSCFTGGTETHLLLVDLREHGLTGKDGQQTLENAGITCNKNGIPFDTQKPTITSGLRFGSPAATTRGFGKQEFELVANLAADVLDGLRKNGLSGNKIIENTVLAKINELCNKFPIY
jgi:glycine hydroxymethyltransferase